MMYIISTSNKNIFAIRLFLVLITPLRCLLTPYVTYKYHDYVEFPTGVSKQRNRVMRDAKGWVDYKNFVVRYNYSYFKNM